MENEHELRVLCNEYGEIGFALVCMYDGRQWATEGFDIESDGHSTKTICPHEEAGSKEIDLSFGERESLKNLLGLELI